MKIRVLMMAALAVTGPLASVASAGAPMGLPAAFLGEGNWAVGAEYGHEQINLEATGTVAERFDESTYSWTQSFKMEDLTADMVFGTLAYGIVDNWDIFLRAGAANASGTIVIPPADTGSLQQQNDSDGGLGFAAGAGTRATFWRSGPWSLGGLAQVTWFQPGDSDFSVADPIIPDESWAGEVSLSYWQAQISLAAVYEVDSLRFWGGPFLHLLRGDMDFSGSALLGGTARTIQWTSDVEEASNVGGHLGASWKLTEQWNLWLEGQITGDSWLVGVGGAFLPEKGLGL